MPIHRSLLHTSAATLVFKQRGFTRIVGAGCGALARCHKQSMAPSSNPEQSHSDSLSGKELAFLPHQCRTPGMEGTKRLRSLGNQVQKKHAKKFSIKNFGAHKPPPPQNSSCRPFSCSKHKDLRGQGSLEGGSGRGVSAQILYVYAFFWFLRKGEGNPEILTS